VSQGLLFSLFDVKDPSQPRLLQQERLGKRGSFSAALWNHHALSVLPSTDGVRFALPVVAYGVDATDPGNLPATHTYPWSWSGLQSLTVSGRAEHDAVLTLGPSLVTHRRGVVTSTGYDFDLGADRARSAVFANGVVFESGGRFWRSDIDGSNASGPF
jgi:hypothetical protein